ncbi:MAG: FkbM family methyltransferase, partial [Solirubrobacteraceae bacterium]
RHRGWSGVLIEAIPELAALCRRRRPRSYVASCALVSPDHAGETIEVQFGDLMSTVGEDGAHAAGGLAGVGRRGYSTTVPARTLSSVIDDASVASIDVIVLDVEGHELDVLAGLDMERHTPRYLLIETLERAAQQPALDRLLAKRYELAEALSDFDLLYRRRD